LKEEALDRTIWRHRFGGGFGPVVRQNTEWMNEWLLISWTSISLSKGLCYMQLIISIRSLQNTYNSTMVLVKLWPISTKITFGWQRCVKLQEIGIPFIPAFRVRSRFCGFLTALLRWHAKFGSGQRMSRDFCKS